MARKQLGDISDHIRRSGKFILRRLSTRALVLVVCIALLLAFFGSWLASSVCQESQVVTPFRGPFSTMCGRVGFRDLFLKSATGYAIDAGEIVVGDEAV
jgi:hypothetical protein